MIVVVVVGLMKEKERTNSAGRKAPVFHTLALC